VVSEVQPELLFHGHHHERFAQMVGDMRIIGLDMDATTAQRNIAIMDRNLEEIDLVEWTP